MDKRSFFDRIIGYDSIKTEFYQLIDMLDNTELYKSYGAAIPKGVILDGPPGCGKSTMCRCFAQASGLPCYTIRRDSGDNDFINKITAAFAKAKENNPSIVFLDDLDKFANEDEQHCDAPEYVAVQAGIDSVKDDNVIVIATSNSTEDLPDSLLRAGRFDRFISVPYPTEQDAVDIIKHYMQDKHVDPDINFEDVVKMIGTDACSVLETILNEAAIYACYAKSDFIRIEHILKAVLRFSYKCPEDSSICSQEEKAVKACHESGHILVSELLDPHSIGLASINSPENSYVGGFTHHCKYVSRENDIYISLAGKVAVELYFPGRAKGCSGDLDRVVRGLNYLISEDGLCGYGALDVSYMTTEQRRNVQQDAVTAQMYHMENEVRSMLVNNRDLLEKLTGALEENDTLLYSDIGRIMGYNGQQPRSAD